MKTIGNHPQGGYGYQEDATGLKLLGHRHYDPTTGRFLTQDPDWSGNAVAVGACA